MLNIIVSENAANKFGYIILRKSLITTYNRNIKLAQGIADCVKLNT